MPRIKSYYKMSFTTVNIKYGGERIIFSLPRELKFDPDLINDALKDQAQLYGFCTMLHKKLLTKFEQLKVERKRIYGVLYFRAKEQKSSITNRLFTDDMAKAWVEKHKRYIKISLACIKAKDDADAIYSCIKSFEQRKDLLQSTSSNLRKES